MAANRRNWVRGVSAALAVLAGLATLWFGLRSYRTFVLLQSAYEVGRPEASALRGWMTLRYVSSTLRVPEAQLLARLDLPPATPPDASLGSIAEARGMSPFDYVKQVQRSIADIVPTSAVEQPATPGWLEWFNDQILSGVLRYGYSVLALTLLLGAMGLPVPTAFAAAIAGSLAAGGQMDWLAAGAVAVAGSVAGDAVAYGFGRGVSAQFLARRGRWFGFGIERQARGRALFVRWGALTVLITRTLVSHLSTVVSLLAGLSHYPLARFLGVATVGRIAWTAAYMGLGYSIGGSLDDATDFLKNLSGLLLALSILAGAMLIASGRVRFGRRAGEGG